MVISLKAVFFSSGSRVKHVQNDSFYNDNNKLLILFLFGLIFIYKFIFIYIFSGPEQRRIAWAKQSKHFTKAQQLGFVFICLFHYFNVSVRVRGGLEFVRPLYCDLQYLSCFPFEIILTSIPYLE
jgi:hypothetical protein